MKNCWVICLFGLFSCNNDSDGTYRYPTTQSDSSASNDTMVSFTQATNTSVIEKDSSINTKGIQPAAIVSFAQTLIGVPYQYASSDPAIGFDCSGFITYVFNYFGIKVPRSSIDFTNVGREIAVTDAKPGDLILFTGTDSSVRQVGHMGIVTSNSGTELLFIHSTSGKKYGVTITPLNGYYKGRFEKVIRIFKENG